MGEVIELDVPTTVDMSPEKVLSDAIEADLAEVLVIGWDKNGNFYGSGSTSDIAENIYLMERLRFNIMSGDFE